MQIINSNKPVFWDAGGNVLANGYVYIGQPNQDPRNFPKTVTFEDSAGGTFTAAQPLRTNSNGQIAYQGNAIKAKVDGNYSMLIQDSNQVTIDDGFIKSVEEIAGGGGDSDLSNYRKYVTNLTDLKLESPSQGETLGLVSSDKTLNSNWLASIDTGNPDDDIDYIRFANGLQGVRVWRSPQPELVWSGSKTSLASVQLLDSEIESFSGHEVGKGSYWIKHNTGTTTTNKITKLDIFDSTENFFSSYIEGVNASGNLSGFVFFRTSSDRFQLTYFVQGTFPTTQDVVISDLYFLPFFD